ncbi:MAG: hypothetical protein ACKO55_12805, partial [Bacteroidota bacterium]
MASAALASSAGSNNQTICLESSISPIVYTTTVANVLNVTGLPNGVSFTWTPSGNVLIISGRPFQSGIYNYTIVLGGGCLGNLTTGTITVNNCLCIPPPAIVTPIGSTTICGPGSVVLNANSGPNLSYQWRSLGNAIQGATNSTFTASASGSYSVVVSNSPNCSTVSAPVNVSINPIPISTISAGGPTTFCAGGSVNLNANTGSGLTYRWRRDSVLLVGATSAVLVAQTSGAYTVEVTALGCSKISDPVQVVVNPGPIASINPGGPTSFCLGGNVVLNANIGAGLTYQWINGTLNIS